MASREQANDANESGGFFNSFIHTLIYGNEGQEPPASSSRHGPRGEARPLPPRPLTTIDPLLPSMGYGLQRPFSLPIQSPPPPAGGVHGHHQQQREQRRPLPPSPTHQMSPIQPQQGAAPIFSAPQGNMMPQRIMSPGAAPLASSAAIFAPPIQRMTSPYGQPTFATAMQQQHLTPTTLYDPNDASDHIPGEYPNTTTPPQESNTTLVSTTGGDAFDVGNAEDVDDNDGQDMGEPLASSNANQGAQEPRSRVGAARRMHYGPAPVHTKRRYTRKRMHLTRGHLVLESSIPSTMLGQLPRPDSREFRTMRYTAATCDPDDFVQQGYTLRQQASNKRQTEIHIVITMYNEDEVLFARTMHGVFRNIEYLCKLKNHHVWGADAWKKVVVTIVADGRKKIHPRVLYVLAAMGIYQEGLAKNVVDDKEVTAHIYEYTTQFCYDDKMNLCGASKGIVPTQVIFCLKEKNAKKINSHRWFFNALSESLQPRVCILLDVGTKPAHGSIFQLWKAFDQNPQIGGACGEIRAMLGPSCRYLLNPLVAAQNFEYKMSNILDKPMESVLGYISVLPGAFSAYRYKALKNDINGNGPLQKYFKGETLHAGSTSKDGDAAKSGSGLFEANMYLAEDRILCFELVAKKNERWLLQYCSAASASTDVPDHLPEFISQRRRWLNGSFFAGIYGLWHFRSLWHSNHSMPRMLLLTIEAIYNVINLLFSWFAMSNLFITFYFITKSLADDQTDPFGNGWGNRFFNIFRCLYLFLIVVIFICSLGNRPQGAKWLFMGCLIGFSVIMMYMIFASAWLVYKGISEAMVNLQWTSDAGHDISNVLNNTNLRNMLVSILATYGLYFVSSLLYLQPWHLFTSMPQYLVLLPGYVNILNIYAFCNTHDVSWGTKGDTAISQDLGVVTKVSEKKEEVILELPTDPAEINIAYGFVLRQLQNKAPPPKEPEQKNQEDGFRSFRTHLVLIWLACNAVLVAVVTSTEYDTLFIPSAGNTYMLVILWTNAALAAFKFIHSLAFRVLEWL